MTKTTSADDGDLGKKLDRNIELLEALRPETHSTELHYHFAPGTDTRVAGDFATSHPVNLKSIA